MKRIVLPGFALSLAVVGAVSAAAAPEPPQRPSSLGVDATLVFLYYEDPERAQQFYGEVLGLELVVEQAFTHIYQIS